MKVLVEPRGDKYITVNILSLWQRAVFRKYSSKLYAWTFVFSSIK